MSSLDDFLARHIEGYAIYDLRSMAKCIADPTVGAGAAGYPMLTTAMAAMELLGTLFCKDDVYQAVIDNAQWNKYRDQVCDAAIAGQPLPQPAMSRPRMINGQQHFTAFWQRFMYTTDPQRAAAGAIYQLVRNGLAHNFVTKGPDICVWKGKSEIHLCTDTEGQVHIDVLVLVKDFGRAYDAFKKALGDAEFRAVAEKRFDELLRLHKLDFERQQAQLTKLPRVVMAADKIDVLSEPSGGFVPTANQSVSTTERTLFFGRAAGADSTPTSDDGDVTALSASFKKPRM